MATSLSPRHSGSVKRIVLIAAAVTSVAGASMYGVVRLFGNGDTKTAAVLTVAVKQGPFAYDVDVNGQIESSVNVDVRCEVKSKGSGGTEILKINFKEGEFAEKGEVLVELDSSALVDDRTQQQIVVARSKADLIRAQSLLDAAKSAQKEYKVGQYVELLAGLESALFIKQEDLRRAEEYYGYSERLAAKGYVTPRQLEADHFAIERARKERHAAQTALDVLKNHTKTEKLQQLAKEVEAAQAVLEAMSASHPLEERRLQDIKEQIEKCKILAPQDGQVVYANEHDYRGNSEFVVEQGVAVRERQVIVKLPNPKFMQVAAKVPESRVQRIEKDMKATITLEALRNLILTGTVETVGSYPLPSSRFGSGVKEFPAVIKIHDPPPLLKTGFRAQVRIHAQAFDDVKTLPIQTIIERGGKHFVIVPDGSTWKAQEVTIGPSNEKRVVIENGLSAGDEVAADARALEDSVKLPEQTAESKDEANGRPGGRDGKGGGNRGGKGGGHRR